MQYSCTISPAYEDDYRPNFESLVKQKTGVSDLPNPAPNDPSFIFFTSGSTGKPKGITHTYETRGWLIASAIKAYEITSDDIILSG